MGKEKEEKNILDLIPVRSYEWEEDEIVYVKVPRFRSTLGQKFCELIKKKDTTYNVKLDKYGSLAWKLIDGKKTVRKIGKALSAEFKDEVEPVFQRVAELFNIMEANKLITYKKNENNSDNEGRVKNGTD
jgi:hypothetical protein